MATTHMPSLPTTYGNVGHMMQKKPKTFAAAVSSGQHSRVNHYGIEVVDKIVWQGWEPGREYTKNIVLKNVKVKTEKIRYKVPDSRFFTTLYPKPIVLSAGTSFTLPVTFRPLEKNVYEDRILFRTKEGDFEVPIQAILPQTELNLPEKLDFTMCCTKDFVELNFEVKNTGDVETNLLWEVREPFSIVPAEATLPHKGVCKFKAIFRPDAAMVYQAKAVCKFGKEYSFSKITRFEGIGKYPHLLVCLPGKKSSSANKDNLETVVQFGISPVGSVLTKWVELQNLTPVRIPYNVQHVGSAKRIDTVFSCVQNEGIAPPMSAIRIPLLYSPNTVGTTSIDYFNVTAIGNISKSIIKCVGSSKGPIIQLNAKAVNFMVVEVGEHTTRTIDISNHSDMEATYQFMIDCDESVFKFEHVTGVLKPDAKQTIILKFYPQHAINYYRRVTCMVHNQGPLYLDLLGTCHSEMIKPSVLLAKHVAKYRTHVERGFSMYPPEQLNELVREGKLEVDKFGTLLIPQRTRIRLLLPDMTEVIIKTVTLETDLVSPMNEYFNDGFHCDMVNSEPHVSTDINLADFGNCQILGFVEDKTVNVTNHTKGKITVQWMGGADRVFSVFPLSMDIPPLKSCSFRLSFKPTVPNQLYGTELECFAFFKSLRDYKLVEELTHCPPWCLTVSCTGHTFMPHNESFLPRYTFDAPHIVFPAVNAKESAYRTILMTNTGTTPILFDLEKDATNTFAIKPAKGLMKGKNQVFVVKATPSEVKTYIQKLTLRLNDNEKYNQVVQFSASAESAEVLLDNDGVLFFKPTCIGTVSKRTYSIKNISRIPLRYEWKFQYADAQFLKVDPDAGIIQPNESQSQTWSFIPKMEEKYVMKPNLILWGQGFHSKSSGGMKRQFVVRAIGEGAVGKIEVDENYYDFGDIVVGNCDGHNLTIHNSSSCSLYYRLLVSVLIVGSDEQHVPEDDPLNSLELDTSPGVLPARSRQTIQLTVKPISRVTYQYSLSYQLLNPQGEVSGVSGSEAQHLCHILVTGVFPVMAVTDARSYGSAVGISKKHLWHLFSLDKMNVCLDSDPSSKELMYNMATRHSHSRRPPVYTRAILDFNFSASPLGSEPCHVTLMFENTGSVETDWAFLFPADLQLELEFWAESGEYDEDELHEMKVMDNKLFSVKPKRGSLAPGECQMITLTYKHTMAGTDRLPVLLKLAGGREILLNFIGVTVEPTRHYIHFPSNKHMFTPVPVGEKISPKQVYELYNGGAVTVKYEFDLTALEIVKKENFDQQIFECLNPTGEIAPGRSVGLEWRFSPLEAKTYMVDVPVHVFGGDTAVITFTGVGFDKRVMGDTMPLTDQQDLSGVPSVQSVAIPGQLMYLSHERISFGNMPLFSKARRMLFLMNRSKEHPVSYEWHVTRQSDSKFVCISPIRGYLEPGETSMCRVAFVAVGVASFYDLDLICEVTDEYQMGEYKQKLKQWEAEKERQKNEFTITEHDLEADRRIPNEVEIERPNSRLDSMDHRRSSVGSEALTKYRTLPPIHVKTADEESLLEKLIQQTKEQFWRKPSVPAPFLLHLGLTVRTHVVEDFQTNFPDDYNKFYIDRALSEKQEEPVAKKVERPELVNCSRAEANLISGVMSTVIRGLLDDAYFYEAIRKVTNEEIPYFRQFGAQTQSPPSIVLSAIPVAASSEVSTVQSQTARSSRASLNAPYFQGSPAQDEERDPGSDRSEDKVMSRIGSRTSCISKASSISSAGSSRSFLRTGSVTHTILKDLEAENLLKEKQLIKKTPEFGNTVESIFENTLLNIINESFNNEFNITARPRFIALPIRPLSGNCRTGKLGLGN